MVFLYKKKPKGVRLTIPLKLKNQLIGLFFDVRSMSEKVKSMSEIAVFMSET